MYYVYIYYDTRREEPFYVGKGHGNRSNFHLKRKDKHPLTHRINKMLRENVIPIVQKIGCSSEDIAFMLEIGLIKMLGRKDCNNGPLLNLCDGGQGSNGKLGKLESLETRKKKSIARVGDKNPMWGIVRPDLTERNIKNSGRLLSEETKSKMSDSRKGATPFKNKGHSLESKNKISVSLLGKKRGPYKRKMINVS
jgi:hypothetical protein